MLSALSIRDIVLIDRLDLSFGKGLAALTGETGAGKSILLDSLGLAIGGRGDGGLVAHGAAQGSVTAVFDVPLSHPSQQLLAENDIVTEGDIFLRRVQTADGRTRAFINDQPVSVSLLRRIGDLLVEIHGQHDERGLLDVSGHRSLLDAYGAHPLLIKKTKECFIARTEALKALREHKAALSKAEEEREFLTHAVAELEQMGPEIGEEEELAQSRSLMMHAEKISSELDGAYDVLSGDKALEARINLSLRRLEQASEHAGDRLKEVIDALDRLLVDVGEAQSLLRDARENMNFDAVELEDSETRLFALRALARKYHKSVDELPALRDEMSEQLTQLENGATHLVELEGRVLQTSQAYEAAAVALSKARIKAAGRLDKKVMAELGPLKLEKAVFKTEMTQLALEEGTADGIDRVAFLISTNPGAPVGPLIKVASGGELSRFILALKVALASAGSAPVMIFDEVDSGVGGAVAEAVGQRLSELANDAQVIVVTHSPQVAAKAGGHLRISKMARTKKANATLHTHVEVLSVPDRREEIARMLAGATITDEARAAADRLIGSEV
ncbi:MAG: DNA repair protein RecN (Recombination protein N) [Parvibaculaceae bacterium]|jgi:DNA repair protein RecN (Recombination protein N)|nr:DNA repair protein RecN [Parvibaculaceae bacterium]